MVGMHAVVFEDEKPLGIELKDCVGQKPPNRAQPFHILWRVLLGIFLPVNHSLVRSQSALNASLQNRAWELSNNYVTWTIRESAPSSAPGYYFT